MELRFLRLFASRLAAAFGAAVSGHTVLARLLRNTAGNTSLIIAASIAPLLAMVGGGIDMGRSYLSEARLQQACDAGVLSARKKLGSSVVADGLVPAGVADTGNRFFNINFRSGTYGTNNRQFTMTLEPDFSISGVATVDVPTTIMKLFAFTKVGVRVVCESRLNYINTDVMMVLDTTGSMNQRNPSDKQSRITVLKSVVQSFHAQLEGSKGAGIRVRYGFVPYAVNVNVGALLRDEWVVQNWTYQSREIQSSSSVVYDYTYTANWLTVAGSYTSSILSVYPATYRPANKETGADYYTCDTPAPAGTYSATTDLVSTASEPFIGPPAGTKTTKRMRLNEIGNAFWLSLNGASCEVWGGIYVALSREYDEITQPAYSYSSTYRYAPLSRDVVNWRSESNGCIEERATYEIMDYNNVDLNQALDLDIDRVPTMGVPATQWRPSYPDVIYGRALNSNGNGSFSVAPVVTNNAYLYQPATYPGLVACPTSARNLAEMNAVEVSSYLASLTVAGNTYHDIGMIWGGRLLSPTGLFAAENADVGGRPTNRHLIFLTDGQTSTNDIAYGSYGIEPLDRRRWTPTSALSLNAVVEKRFGAACNEVKKRNITVWVIGFGTTMSQPMKDCAGNGRWFQADSAVQLNTAFAKIAASMGDLRISK